MSHSESTISQVVPAQLNFLTIYNPTLHASSETDQIVFYYSKYSRDRSRQKYEGPSKPSDENEAAVEDEQNERMRQIGLARGMVDFARKFANGKSVDSVETEKHRIVIHELEPSWWILASIDLTCIPNNKASSSKATDSSEPVEYSAREVSPSVLLSKQLLQAYRVFLLHHGRSLSDIYDNLKRDKFCGVLNRYWTKFALNWDVLLHGNPSADIYGGIKLAAGGELGIGVGEEDWGSGEREVLEGLVRSTNGLVDLVVSRYGGSEMEGISDSSRMATEFSQSKASESNSTTWLGLGADPGPDDGLIFSGQDVLTRDSMQTLTEWIRYIYIQGEEAYGVRENPSSTRRKRRRKQISASGNETTATETQNTHDHTLSAEQSSLPKNSSRFHPSIPPPIVSAAEESLKAATKSADNQNPSKDEQPIPSPSDDSSSQPWVKYLTLGYGSVWGPSSKVLDSNDDNQKPRSTTTKSTVSEEKKAETSKERANKYESPSKLKTKENPSSSQHSGKGHFIIGLRGDLDDDDQPKYAEDDESDKADAPENAWTSRLSLRTLHLQVIEDLSRFNDNNGDYEQYTPNETRNKVRLLRVVVYAHHPFIYTLLFDPNAASLTFPSFYHDLHHHLTPLHGPLLKSTSPRNVARRLKSVLSDQSHVFDVVHSAQSLSTRCSIPNIPHPGAATTSGNKSYPSTNSSLAPSSWSRAEALSVHVQVLQTFIDTRNSPDERERTMKTSRGWWIVWMDVPTAVGKEPEESSSTKALQPDDQDDAMHSEAVLVRKAQEPAPATSSWMGGGYSSSSLRLYKESSGSALGRLMGREANSSSRSASMAVGGSSSGRLTEGLGLSLDPKKYVEVLLSLNR